jgi:mannan endo-1,6-alpha-mannosidase
MSAMSVFQNLLIGNAKPPLTLGSGATSKGDAGAGAGSADDELDNPILTNPILTADKVGASILTILCCGLAAVGSVWMVSP